MPTLDLSFCTIELYENYLILVIAEDVILTLEKAMLIRNSLIEHFGNQPFVMINYKKNRHRTLPEVYKKGQLKNMKGLAIVSNCNKEREQALLDQKIFHKSFAFFQDIDAARSWATSYFR